MGHQQLTEAAMAQNLAGCYFALNYDGRVVNRGWGTAPWERRAKPRLKLPPPAGRGPLLAELAKMVSSVTEVSLSEMRSRGRSVRVTQARQAFAVTSHLVTEFSYSQIATFVGLDHTTVLYAVGCWRAGKSKAAPFVGKVMNLLRDRYDNIDDMVTEIKLLRKQSAMNPKCHECQVE